MEITMPGEELPLTSIQLFEVQWSSCLMILHQFDIEDLDYAIGVIQVGVHELKNPEIKEENCEIPEVTEENESDYQEDFFARFAVEIDGAGEDNEDMKDNLEGAGIHKGNDQTDRGHLDPEENAVLVCSEILQDLLRVIVDSGDSKDEGHVVRVKVEQREELEEDDHIENLLEVDMPNNGEEEEMVEQKYQIFAESLPDKGRKPRQRSERKKTQKRKRKPSKEQPAKNMRKEEIPKTDPTASSELRARLATPKHYQGRSLQPLVGLGQICRESVKEDMVIQDIVAGGALQPTTRQGFYTVLRKGKDKPNMSSIPKRTTTTEGCMSTPVKSVATPVRSVATPARISDKPTMKASRRSSAKARRSAVAAASAATANTSAAPVRRIATVARKLSPPVQIAATSPKASAPIARNVPSYPGIRVSNVNSLAASEKVVASSTRSRGRPPSSIAATQANNLNTPARNVTNNLPRGTSVKGMAKTTSHIPVTNVSDSSSMKRISTATGGNPMTNRHISSLSGISFTSTSTPAPNVMSLPTPTRSTFTPSTTRAPAAAPAKNVGTPLDILKWNQTKPAGPPGTAWKMPSPPSNTLPNKPSLFLPQYRKANAVPVQGKPFPPRNQRPQTGNTGTTVKTLGLPGITSRPVGRK